MDVRICSNPACRTIQPYDKCGNCGTATTPLPRLSLAPVGVNGTAHLIHNPSEGYAIMICAPSHNSVLSIPIHDLVQHAQPQLPHINPISGLHIMDTLSVAANLMRSRNTGQWSGWILYLLEVLQGHTDPAAFQEFLKDVRGDLNVAIVEDTETSPTDLPIKRGHHVYCP